MLVSQLIRQIESGKRISRDDQHCAAWDLLSERLRDDLWLQVQQWIADEDIRLVDPNYSKMKLDALTYYLAQVEAEEKRAPTLDSV